MAIAVFLAALAIWAAAWGVAAHYSAIARDTINKWDLTGEAGDKQKRQEIAAALATAAALNPLDATIRFDLARLAEWEGVAVGRWSLEGEGQDQLAIDLYQETVDRRPSWSMAYINTSYLLVSSGSIDSRAIYSLKKGLQYGSCRPATLRQGVPIGLALWDVLPPEDQESIKFALIGALSSPNTSYQIIFASVWLHSEERLTPYLRTEKQKNYLARQIAIREARLKKK